MLLDIVHRSDAFILIWIQIHARIILVKNHSEKRFDLDQKHFSKKFINIIDLIYIYIFLFVSIIKITVVLVIKKKTASIKFSI